MADGTDGPPAADGASSRAGDGASDGAGDVASDDAGDGASRGLDPDWRVLAVVLLCVAALVALAAMAPALAESPAGAQGGPGNESGQQDPEAGQQESDDGESGGASDGSGGSGGRTAGPGGSVGGSALPDSRDVGGPISTSDYRNAGSQLVLVADAERPAYWRMGAYDTYRNGRWVRSGDVGSLTPDHVRRRGSGDLTQRIWLNASMRTLPAAWRPRDVQVVDSSGSAEIAADGRVGADGWLPAGTQYRVQSVRPTRNPEQLRAAGTDYPPELRERYTQLPPDSTDRLERFTDQLTAGAESPYDQARIVEAWMRRNKEYDLNSSHDRSRPLFDEVVFEMDTVYCTYAASGMVGMLRTQGVPARYATGYSYGVETDGRYAVTEQQAHAWVEVYVPDEGWVSFDPTPPDRRRDREASRLRNDSGAVREGLQQYAEQTGRRPPGDLQQFRETDPGERDGSGAGGDGRRRPVGVPDVDASDFRSGEQRTPDGYVLRYNQSRPTPGTQLAVSVTRDGEAVPGVVVRFDGEPVGETDADGAVVGTVPWVRMLNLSVDRPSSAAGPAGRSAGIGASQSARITASQSPGTVASQSAGIGASDAPAATARSTGTAADQLRGAGDALRGAADSLRGAAGSLRGDATTPGRVAGSGPTAAGRSTPSVDTGRPRPATAAAPTQRSNATVALETRGQIDVAVDGPRLPGGTVAVTARIDDRHVPDASVRIDGDRVAQTDDRGTAEVTLPSASGNATIRVERGEIAGERTLVVEPLQVAVVDGYAVPDANVDLEVAASGEPLSDHEVLLDGRSLGRTGESGRVAATLPSTTGDVPVAIRGDAVDATRYLSVERPSVAVVDLLPLPGRPATVRVEHAGEPVPGAAVAVDGESRATTGEDGTATVPLPVADAVRIEATVDGATGATTPSHIYLNAAVLAVVLLAVVGGALLLVVRRLRGSGASGRGAVASAGGWLRSRLVWLGRFARRASDRIVDAAVRLGRALGRAARWAVGAATTAFGRGALGLLAVPGHLLRGLRWLLRALDPRRLPSRLRALLERDPTTDASAEEGPTYDLDDGIEREEGEPDPGVLELRDVWRAFVRAVRPPNATTRTVGEIGRYAVGRGLPREPVRTVVETYRAAEYGRRSPSAGRLRRAAAAVRRVAGDPTVLEGQLPDGGSPEPASNGGARAGVDDASASAGDPGGATGRSDGSVGCEDGGAGDGGTDAAVGDATDERGTRGGR